METTGSPEKKRNDIQNYSKLLKIRKKRDSAISTLTYYRLELNTDPGVHPTRLIHTWLQQAYYPTDTATSVTKDYAYHAPTLRCVYIYFHTSIPLHGMLNFAQSQLYLHESCSAIEFVH
jgi:hypothetical protein